MDLIIRTEHGHAISGRVALVGGKVGLAGLLPELDLMGVSSGPRWRAYIAARSLIWAPGKTRRPVPRTRGRWGWSATPNDYPVLTIDDKRRLAFGDQDASNRRTRSAILAPWQKLPDVVVLPATDPRTGIRGWRLLPKEAKKALLALAASESK